MLVGKRLRQIREIHGSLDDVAPALGMSKPQLGNYELEKTEPTSGVLLRIARYFEVSTDYLLGLTDDPTGRVSIKGLSQEEQTIISAIRRGDRLEAIRLIANHPPES